MATANIEYTIGNGGLQTVNGEAIGLGGEGGQSHSEQGVWADAQDAIVAALNEGKAVSVKFIVDTTICYLCSPWFEDTVWQKMNNANNNGSFKLVVEVNGNTVLVNSDRTIWPNEIADSPTWERLSEFEKMDRFLTDGRDDTGALGVILSDYVVGLHESLNTQRGIGNINNNEIEQCLGAAKTDACRLQVAAYDFRDPAAMEAQLRDIDLFMIMSSGRGTIPVFSYDKGRDAWKWALTKLFQAWIEDWIYANLDEHRIQTPY